MRGYEALKRAAAWRDLSSRGRLKATGEDRVRLIHAIASNAVEGLAPGQGVYSFFLDAQGHIQADSNIFVDDDHLVIDSEPAAGRTLLDHIESYIIMDDVTLEDIGSSTALLAVAGPSSRDIAASLSRQLPDAPLAFVKAGLFTIYRAPVGETEGFRICAPLADRERLIDELESQGAVPAAEESWEALRVRQGIPRFGTDFGPRNIPHETQQLQAVSFTKGCYTGQEIVERVRSQGRVRRLLVGVELDSADLPDDLTVRFDGTEVGGLTSPTPGTPDEGTGHGFAIVKRLAATPGTVVRVGETTGTVTDVARE